MSPSFNPLRSVAPTCIVAPVGSFDQIVRVVLLGGSVAFARRLGSSVLRNAVAAATALTVAPPPAGGRCSVVGASALIPRNIKPAPTLNADIVHLRTDHWSASLTVYLVGEKPRKRRIPLSGRRVEI